MCVLLDVFPERGIQTPRNVHETEQKQHDEQAQAHALGLGRLTHPLQVAHQISHGLIVLLRCHGARCDLFPALEDLGGVAMGLNRPLGALQK